MHTHTPEFAQMSSSASGVTFETTRVRPQQSRAHGRCSSNPRRFLLGRPTVELRQCFRDLRQIVPDVWVVGRGSCSASFRVRQTPLVFPGRLSSAFVLPFVFLCHHTACKAVEETRECRVLNGQKGRLDCAARFYTRPSRCPAQRSYSALDDRRVAAT